MHLLERYSLAAGAKIDKCYVNNSFYPVNVDKYIALSPYSGNMPAKNYQLWNIVLDILAPELDKAGIKVVQLGSAGEPPLKNTVYLCGQTTIAQSAYIVKNALMLLGVDSFMVHVASALDVPLVALYSVSSPNACGPYFGDKSKQILLEPHFQPGETYSYNPQGAVACNSIKPEEVAAAVSKLLDLPPAKFETKRIGAFHNLGILDIIPNCALPPNVFPNNPLSIRYDKGGDENTVYQQLSARKATVVTDKPLNVNALKQLAPNIERIIYLVGADDKPEFVKEIQRAGIPYGLVSRLPDDELNEKKLNYFDYGVIEKAPDGKRPDDFEPDWKFKTGKRIIAGGKMYLSYAHVAADKSIDNAGIDSDTVIDDPVFFTDLENYFLWK